tara:strand:- start:3283 stop:4581 length:1299 start_codon:yes stop_codon:yes gene_type:complete
MVRKQKTKSYFPSSKEYHTPGYNFNGPGTSIPERLSLNYKGRVGSSSYFLPVNRLDMAAFRHDLHYYSPESITQTHADKNYLEYLNKHQKKYSGWAFLSKAAIQAQILKRVMLPYGQLGLSQRTAYKAFMKSDHISGFLHDFARTPREQGQGSIMGWLLNKHGSQRFSPKMKDYFRSLGLKTTFSGASKKRRDAQKQALVNTISWIIFGNGLKYFQSGENSKELTKIQKFIALDYKNSEEWKDVNDSSNKVIMKYEDYLKSVGFFDKDDNFVVKHSINEIQAEDKYKEFYKEYQDYVLFMDGKYKYYPGFKPQKIPELNQNNLDMVSLPIIHKPKKIVITETTKEKLKDMTDPDKVFNKYKNVNKYDEDIINVLKGIKDTSVPDDRIIYNPSQYMIPREKYDKDIIDVLKGIKDTSVPDDRIIYNPSQYMIF